MKSSRCPYRTQNKGFSDKNISKDTGKALVKNILPIKDLDFEFLL